MSISSYPASAHFSCFLGPFEYSLRAVVCLACEIPKPATTLQIAKETVSREPHALAMVEEAVALSTLAEVIDEPTRSVPLYFFPAVKASKK